MIQYHQFPYNKTPQSSHHSAHTPRKGHVRAQPEGSFLQVRKRALSEDQIDQNLAVGFLAFRTVRK